MVERSARRDGEDGELAMSAVIVPEHIAAEQALRAMYRDGAGPADGAAPIFDEARHRYRVEGGRPGTLDGAYQFFPGDKPGDTAPGGWYQNHKIHDEPIKWTFLFKDGPADLYREWKAAHGISPGRDARAYPQTFQRSGHSGTGLTPETPEEKAARLERVRAKMREQEQAAREAEIAAKYEKAAQRAQGIYSGLQDARPEHPYLVRKGIHDVYGPLKQRGKELIAPLYDGFISKGARIVSLQFIDGDGKKRFLTDGKTRGAFFPIGIDSQTEDEKEAFYRECCEKWDKLKTYANEPLPKREHTPNPVLFIAEGVATGMTIYDFLKYGEFFNLSTNPAGIICAMNAGNLRPVSEYCRAALPGSLIFICADNDWRNEKNAGLEYAIDIVDAGIADEMINPPSFTMSDGKPGTDWNDYCLVYGFEKAASVLARTFAKALAAKKNRKD